MAKIQGLLVIGLIGLYFITLFSDRISYEYETYEEVLEENSARSTTVPMIASMGSNIVGWYSIEAPITAVEFRVEGNNIQGIKETFGGVSIKPKEGVSSHHSYTWSFDYCELDCLYFMRSGPGDSKEHLAISERRMHLYYWANGYSW